MNLAAQLYRAPLPDPTASLCGTIETGGEPQLFRSDQCPLWPVPIETGAQRIFIDGYFVFDEKLYLGRSHAERMHIGTAIAETMATDPRAFLRRVQNGFFNIVVNDRERRETRIFNDSFGGLPLYLLHRRERLLFASTYAGLRQLAEKDLELDCVGLAELYWFGYPLGNHTVWRNVSLLPPGSMLTVRWADGETKLVALAEESVAPALPSTIGALADRVVESMHIAGKRLFRPEVNTGAKISAGMDSRLICATWPGERVTAYTYGYPASAEVKLAGRLAQTLGMQHRFVPIEEDFFTRLHAPFFPLHGLAEFFHQAAMPQMRKDGVEVVLDGLAGDILFGGLALKRPQQRWRQALGLRPRLKSTPASDEAIAEDILRQIRVPDSGYRPLNDAACSHLDLAWEAIRADMTAQVSQARSTCDTYSGSIYDGIYTEVIFRNRTRRYISLQGTLCRPQVETLYPFLDRDLQQLRGRIPAAWAANKQLYLEIYSRRLPRIRSVPSLFSLLPFVVPTNLHHAGRILRYGREQLGLKLDFRTRGRLGLWPANGVQWSRWLAFNEQFREGARVFMRNSAVFDEQEFDRAIENIARGPKMSATRFMLTASYCGHFSRHFQEPHPCRSP